MWIENLFSWLTDKQKFGTQWSIGVEVKGWKQKLIAE